VLAYDAPAYHGACVSVTRVPEAGVRHRLLKDLAVVCSSLMYFNLHSDCVHARGVRGRRVGLIGLQAVDIVAV